jgi:hypothetical protein
MISLSLLGDTDALRRLKAMRDTVRRGMARTVTKLGSDLKNSVRRNKLTDSVVQTHSGPLRRSTARRIDPRNARVSAIATGHFNAATRDYRSSGRMDLRASLRQSKEAFRYPVNTNDVGVGAFSRQMQIYPRRALGDTAPDIRISIKDALRQALGK